MAGDAAAPVLTGSAYVLASRGRAFPTHSLTPKTIIRKRVNEQTSSLALSVGLVLPTMTKVHMRLDTYVVEGIDLPLGKVVEITLASSKETAVQFVDQLARIGVQTGFCCLLLRSRTAYGSSVVYLWDVFPRLHQHYIGELVRFLRLPPFLSTLLGPPPQPSELQVLTAPISPLAAMEDSVKRNTLQLLSDVVVDVAGSIVQRQFASKGERSSVRLTAKAAMHMTLAVLKIGGAAAGHAVAGSRGEYWGEMAGIATAPMAFAQMTLLLHTFRRRRRRTTLSGGQERTRSSSSGRDKGSVRSSVRRPNPVKKE